MNGQNTRGEGLRISKNIGARAIAEIVFDVAYLLFGVLWSAWLVTRATKFSVIFGAAGLALAFGDAFHLLPRVAANASGDFVRYARALGRGKQITSVTMTIFYVLLYHSAEVAYFGDFGAAYPIMTIAVWLTAIVRVVFCLMGTRQWTASYPDPVWALWRNIPFVLLGGLVAGAWGVWSGGRGAGLAISIAIALSFAFYIPVALGAHRFPTLGMLMIPKTAMYIWLLCMGAALM